MKLAQLLDALMRFVRRYIVLTDAQLAAVVLWIAHTHAFDAAECTPYLHIRSAVRQSGKSHLLDVLAVLVRRPWKTARATPAAIPRKVEGDTPTMLHDETDAAFGGNQESAEMLRGILNAGYERGAVVSVCEGQGTKMVVRDFRVFSPKALAGLARLPDTIEDRAIPIIMKRRNRHAPEELIEKLRKRRLEVDAFDLKMALELWASEAVAVLKDADPSMPEQLTDRQQDGWTSLFAVADLAGGDWPERARKAAVTLHGDGAEDDEQNLGIRLLADCRTFFADGKDRATSAEFLAYLVGLETSPWGDLDGRQPTVHRLAALLRPFGIRPGTIRVNQATPKGYYLTDFTDAFSRYLAPILPGDPPHPPQPNTDAGFGAIFNPPQTPLVADTKNDETPHQKRLVADVADREEEWAQGGTAASLLTTAEGKLWPRCPYKPGHTILAGETNWRLFVHAYREDEEELRLALAALEALP